MIKITSFTLGAIFILLIVPKDVHAALVSINKEGRLIVNVLSITQADNLQVPQSDNLQVKRLVDEEVDVNKNIALRNQNGEVELSINDGIEKKTLDVTTYEDEVIEIEERPKTQKLSIRIENGHFILNQDKVTVITDYDINVDPKSAKLTLRTPSGHRFLSILPKEALDGVFRSNTLDIVDNIELKEGNDGILAYEIAGKRVLNIIDIIDYEVPVRTRVSVSTGEIFDIDQPNWLNFVGFIFS